MLDARFRVGLERVTGPLGGRIARWGIRADHLTAAGVLFALLAGAVVARGELVAGAALLVTSSLPDLLDGPVARAGGATTRRGEFFDSVADRVSDSAVLAGLAWHFLSGTTPRLAALVVSVMALSLLISYQRAKAESLGLRAKGGLMERGERVVALTVALAFPAVLVPVLWVMAVLTALTALQRFAMVWRQATAASAPAALPAHTGVDAGRRENLGAPQVAWRPGRVESRWRAWRQQARAGSGGLEPGAAAASRPWRAQAARRRSRRSVPAGARSYRTSRPALRPARASSAPGRWLSALGSPPEHSRRAGRTDL